MPRGSAYAWLCLVTVAVAVAAFAGWHFLQNRPNPADPEGRPARVVPFHECAAEVGLNFRMRFLPDEQGETFKINLYDHGSGLAVGDFDGDGLDDLYFCNQLGKNTLFRNNGDGTFEDVTDRAGVGLGDRVCVAATFADFDNDGKADLYVTSTRGGNVLFHNKGDGTFADVTDKAGLRHVGHSQTALFFDFDNDGLLDLFLTNTAKWTTDQYDKTTRHYLGLGELGGVMESPKEWNVLYRNNGNGTFTDVTEKAGLKGRGWAADAVPFDYDGDGKMDLVVTSMFGRAQLYRNNGNGTFTDVTLKVLGQTPWGGLGARVFDYDNDGRLDLVIVDMHSDMWMGLDFEHQSLKMVPMTEKRKFRHFFGPRVQYDPSLVQREIDDGMRIGFRHEEVIFGNGLYRNEGNGKFTEVSDAAGLETFWPWGIATGDFDNNGLEDVFLPSGMGYPFYYWPNYLLMNQGDGTFVNRADRAGIEPPRGGQFLPEKINGKAAARSSRCAVAGDFDGDGRLEIVTNNFNDGPYFFKNQSARKNWVAFRLRGTKSNRDAVGAVVRLRRRWDLLTRQVLAGCGYLSQSSQTLHFGLGDDNDVEQVEVTWPSGVRQVLKKLEVNKRYDLVEPGGEAAREGK